MMSNAFVLMPALCYPLAAVILEAPTASPTTPDAPMATTKVLISSDAIAARIRSLAAEITRDHADAGQLHLVCVLKGAFLFLADLVRAIDIPVTLDFMALSSYAKGTTSSGEVRLLKDLDTALEGKHVIVVEDIVDTGLTLHYLQEILAARGPKSVRTACLLSKPSRRKIDVRVEYIGFTIEDHFVVGYGLDYAEQHRNLPHIAVLETEA
jgi:hypoxanthine phosphoribosyltransferase